MPASTVHRGIKNELLSASQEMDKKVDYNLFDRNSNTCVSHLLGHAINASVGAPSAATAPGFGNDAHEYIWVA